MNQNLLTAFLLLALLIGLHHPIAAQWQDGNGVSLNYDTERMTQYPQIKKDFDYFIDMCIDGGESAITWFHRPLNGKKNFVHTFCFFLGDITNGAEGLTFFFRNSKTIVAGIGGAGLGYENPNDMALSLALEVDCRSNGNQFGDASLNIDHLAVVENGHLDQIVQSLPGKELVFPVNSFPLFLAQLDDSLPHLLKIEYNESILNQNSLNIYVDNLPVLSLNYNLLDSIIDSSSPDSLIYFGISAGASPLVTESKIWVGVDTFFDQSQISNFAGISGSAQYVDEKVLCFPFDQQIYLTDSCNQVGSAWAYRKLDLTKCFDYEVCVGLGAGLSEGLMFVFSKDNLFGRGLAGPGMGYYGNHPNTYAIELDIQDNGIPYKDSAFHHFSIVADGDLNRLLVPPQEATASREKKLINTKQVHTLRFQWDSRTHFFQIFKNDTLAISHTIDLITTIFEGENSIHFGVIGTTNDMVDTLSVSITDERNFNCTPIQEGCEKPFDFNNGFIQSTDPRNGKWQVSPNGTKVTQLVNGHPTFFYDQHRRLINVRIKGKIKGTKSENDPNDFIGVSLATQLFPGYPYNRYEGLLFSWRREDQFSNECGWSLAGCYLSRLNGVIIPAANPCLPEFGNNQGSLPTFESLGFVPGKAWPLNEEIDFEVIYTTTNLTIIANSDTLFNLPGCYEPAHFGLYNYSQYFVDYYDFSYELLPDFDLPTDTICQGDTITIDFLESCAPLLTAGVFESLVWDFGDGQKEVLSAKQIREFQIGHRYLDHGNFMVQLTLNNDYNCQSTVSRQIVVLPHPQTNLHDAIFLCHGEVAYLNATNQGAQYRWQNGSEEPILIADSTGYYWVEVDNNRCRIRDSVYVHIYPDLVFESLEIETGCFLQNDGQLDLTSKGGQPPYEFLLENNRYLLINNDGRFPGLSPGDYFLQVTDQNQCFLDTTIRIPASTYPSFSWTSYDAQCQGEADGRLEIEAFQNGLTFSLNNQQFNKALTFDQLDTGMYHLYVQDTDACIFSESFFIGEPAKIEIQGKWQDTITIGSALQLQPLIYPPDSLLYHWSPATDISCIDCHWPEVTPLIDTRYTLTVTDKKGCTISQYFDIHVDKNCELGIPNIFTPNGDGVNDIWMIRGGPCIEQIVQLEIFARNGGLLFQQNHFSPNTTDNGWDGTFQGAKVAVGVYVYSLNAVFVDGRSIQKHGTITLVR